MANVALLQPLPQPHPQLAASQSEASPSPAYPFSLSGKDNRMPHTKLTIEFYCVEIVGKSQIAIDGWNHGAMHAVCSPFTCAATEQLHHTILDAYFRGQCT